MASSATTGMTLTDLPLDVLHLIFDEFRDPEVTSHGTVDWNPSQSRGWRPSPSSRLRTIQNARLSCRTLHAVASPLLCPVLHVRLSQRSLDAARGLARSPLVASGLHGVLVHLDYRPAELAGDLGVYVGALLRELAVVDDACRASIFRHHRAMSDDVDDDDVEASRHLDDCTRCRFEYRVLCGAWHAAAQGRAVSPTPETQLFQAMLREGFEAYGRLHDEQARIVDDGSFVQGVATMVASAGHAVSLAFVDESTTTDSLLTPDVFSTILDKQRLAAFMVRPQSWREMEAAGAKLAPAPILSQLPEAVRQAGGALSQLAVCCFPH